MWSSASSELPAWAPKKIWHRLPVRQRYQGLDLLVNFCVFTPLVILHAQATNSMLDYLFMDRFPRFGAWSLLLLGISVEFVLCFTQKRLVRTFLYDIWNRNKIYCIILLIQNILQWKSCTTHTHTKSRFIRFALRPTKTVGYFWSHLLLAFKTFGLVSSSDPRGY